MFFVLKSALATCALAFAVKWAERTALPQLWIAKKNAIQKTNCVKNFYKLTTKETIHHLSAMSSSIIILIIQWIRSMYVQKYSLNIWHLTCWKHWTMLSVLFSTLSLYPTVYSFIVLNNEPIIHDEHQFTEQSELFVVKMSNSSGMHCKYGFVF